METVATVPSGINGGGCIGVVECWHRMPRLGLGGLLDGGERFALSGTGELLDQRAKAWRFNLFEPTGAILGWIAPLIGIGADEGARRRLAVAEVDPMHRDDF